MRQKILLLLMLLSAYTISAQLTITAGTQFLLTSDVKLTLHNTDFINNNGDLFLGSTSPVSFTGNVSSFIGGTTESRFFRLEINKTGNHSVSLQKSISAGGAVLFTSGFFDLNGFDLDLETSGQLSGESENSRIIGANGGKVIFSTNLNNPLNANPANLGAIITSNQNLGNVIIRRGHLSQSGSGLVNSMLRYYEIVPENNSNLDASLQISYFIGEINGLDENSFVFFKTDDGINWSNEGFTSRNTNGNFINKTGIISFSRWTLSNDSDPLPVHFILFNARCEDNNLQLSWKTAQEQNSSRFDVERSVDGIRWTVIGSIPASGNSNSEKTYSFSDNNPVPNSFYRIAELDLNGRKQFTAILRSSCTITDMFKLWPNPAHDNVFINIVSNIESQVVVRLFDGKGALVKIQRATVLPGSNQLTMNIGSLTIGVYHVTVDWNNGQMKRTIKVLKQ